MGNEDLNKFLAEFNEQVVEATRFCYLVRDIDFQRVAKERLDNFSNRIITIQSGVIEAGEEENANILLACLCFAKAITYELQMWISLKEGDIKNAWENLISAQDGVSASIRAHNIAKKNIEQLERLSLLENALFPPQQFISTGLIIHKCECTICGSDFDSCDHITGRPYMGKFCSRFVSKWEPIEASFVKEPADKRCRVEKLFIDGANRDVMTWREIKE